MEDGRYSIYSWEMGFPQYNPYHVTNDREEAEIVCSDLARNNKVNVTVFDRDRGINYFCVIFNSRKIFKK